MLKWVFLKIGAVISAIALFIGTISVVPACIVWFYQPEVPASMAKYRKIH
jgi:cyclic lactone autoinducer peptide